MQCFLSLEMIVRLYCNEKLKEIGQRVCLNDKQIHYLGNVLRMKIGDVFYLFDGENGEFEAQISDMSKKSGLAVLLKQTQKMRRSPDVWLLFAPLKKDKTDMVLQKATELGVRKIIPVQTDFTNAEKVRLERYETQVEEAAEQCRRLDVPELENISTLDKVLENWPEDRTLFFMNEKGAGSQVLNLLANAPKAAILIGPEGGVSQQECKKLLERPFVKSIYLRGQILRAETAAIAALSCWQAVNGDWAK